MEKRIFVIGVFTLCTLATVLSQGDDGFWRPAQRAKKFRNGEPTFIYTHGNNKYNQAWYTVQDRNEFVFAVKACSDVKLALATYIAMTDFSIDIVLGEQHNTMAVIKYPFEAGYLSQVSTPKLLHCHEYRTFWVTWHLDYIEVGRGPSIGQQKLLSYFDSSLHVINTISLSSGEDTAAVWKINGNTGDLMDIVTPDEYKYTTLWKAVKERHFYSFQVKSCGDVHVLLSEQFGEQLYGVYEFSIGGWKNNRSVIRTSMYGSNILDEHYEYGIVSCYEYRDFWISWYNGSISVGKGDMYGMHRFLHYKDENPLNIRWLSITTGFGNHGSWLLDDDEETINMVYTPHSNSTPPDRIYNTTWISMPKERYFQFFARAGGPIRLLLAEDTAVVEEDEDIEITIGSEGGTKICVGYMFEPGCLAEYTGENLISELHNRPFWISWFNHSLHLGKGLFYGGVPLIRDIPLPPDLRIHAIALATSESWGRWKFREYMGERVEYRTPAIFNYEANLHTWRTVYTKHWFLFYFFGTSDCHVSLSPLIGIDEDLIYYDVIIGGWDNTRSVIVEIYNKKHTKEVSPAADTPGIIKADSSTEFWVSWYNGYVEVGKGSIVGMERFLDYDFGDAIKVKAVSIQTGWDHSGSFHMYEDLGDYVTFYTNGSRNDKSWKADHYLAMDPYLKFVTFWIKACKEASVYIGSVYNDGTKMEHYEVRFATGEENRQVQIWHGEEMIGPPADLPVVLACDANYQYWVSWWDGKIKVGGSYIYDQHNILEADELMNYNFSVVGFGSTQSQDEARWHVSQLYGFDFEVYTTEDYGYKNWFLVEHKDYLYFSVRACSDVHILLTERIGHQWGFSYEIVIGGWANSRSVIREWLEDEHGQRMPEYVVLETANILNCTAQELFHLSWGDGAIIVRKGWVWDDYRTNLMDYHPVNPRPVRAVAFSTGYGHSGHFIVGLGGETVSPPATPPPTTPYPPASGSGGLSGGAIAGIVIGVLSFICLFIAVAYLIMITRGVLKTPEPLQTPVEGSGFTNPVAASATTSADKDKDHEADA